ncbi:MAG TPA: sigma factor-like helix-turn-helix DNA-binding protein, partial [Blastocatellia bacterium]|jgi:RNA polymerase sigma-70 factor (ECF subfamily)
VDLDEFLLEQVEALTQPFVTDRGADEALKLALDNVPADYALVLRLRFLDEMPLKRIAAFLGVPVSTVKWRAHRGKQLVREQMGLLKRGEKWKEIEK